MIDIATLRARLLPQHRPGCWLGLVIRAFGGELPHWLVAGWEADAVGLYGRLPEFAVMASPDADRALAQLFAQVPPDARVLLVSPEQVDAALVAQMVLEVDRNLQPWHRDALQAFVDAQRAADLARIRGRYTDRDEGFERFAQRLTGGHDDRS